MSLLDKLRTKTAKIGAVVAIGLASVYGIQKLHELNPANAKIVYISNIYETPNQMYIMDSDGSNQQELTQINKRMTDERVLPSLSPDGKRLVFHSAEKEYFEIFTMNTDGTNLKRLTNNTDYLDVFPVWSPDGKKIAFESDQDGSGIYIMDSDGTDTYKLIKGGLHPSWSPDGTKIAFSFSPDKKNRELFTINIDGTNLKQLTDYDAEFVRDSTWSPDGNQIAFCSEIEEPRAMGLNIINSDGTNLRRLTFNNNNVNGRKPTWSPDGTRIAFESSIPDEDSEICIINADGSNLQQLTNNSYDDFNPLWVRSSIQRTLEQKLRPKIIYTSTNSPREVCINFIKACKERDVDKVCSYVFDGVDFEKIDAGRASGLLEEILTYMGTGDRDSERELFSDEELLDEYGKVTIEDFENGILDVDIKYFSSFDAILTFDTFTDAEDIEKVCKGFIVNDKKDAVCCSLVVYDRTRKYIHRGSDSFPPEIIYMAKIGVNVPGEGWKLAGEFE